MSKWQRDALAVGFQLDAITLVAEFVAGGVVAVDGPPIEVLPDYWVIPGFLPYDGLVILAALDRRKVAAEPGPLRERRWPNPRIPTTRESRGLDGPGRSATVAPGATETRVEAAPWMTCSPWR
jgi:hypothetical protein